MLKREGVPLSKLRVDSPQKKHEEAGHKLGHMSPMSGFHNQVRVHGPGNCGSDLACCSSARVPRLVQLPADLVAEAGGGTPLVSTARCVVSVLGQT